MYRRSFLKRSPLAAGACFVFPGLCQDRQSPMDTELVKEFVAVAHRDLNRVEGMLDRTPALLHCAWDWGGGDFETAIGAGSHVGNREIVCFLLSKGARMNIFSAAMLGEVDLVKNIIELFPSQLYAHGPHGLSLMHHALKGGVQSEDVVDLLNSMGVEE